MMLLWVSPVKSSRNYGTMTPQEVAQVVREIVERCDNASEIRRLIITELNYPYDGNAISIRFRPDQNLIGLIGPSGYLNINCPAGA